jgi:hypothetical protein
LLNKGSKDSHQKEFLCVDRERQEKRGISQEEFEDRFLQRINDAISKKRDAQSTLLNEELEKLRSENAALIR